MFRKHVENQTNLKLFTLRSDRDGEYTSTKFIEYYELNGINKLVSTACTPHQNRSVERKNQTILEKVRSMLLVGNVPI